MSRSEQSLVLIGGYAEAAKPGIHLFWLDSATGSLAAGGAVAGISNPSFLAPHPRQPWLYAASETNKADGAPGSVWALRFKRDPLGFTPINHQPSGGDSPCHVRIDRSGHWLLVCNYGGGSASVLPVLPDGSLGEMADHVQHVGSGANPERQDGPHAHSSTFTPDQRFAIVADLGLDQLLVYAFDSEKGKLAAHDRIQTRAGAGPRHMAFHPGGELLYVANELDGTVTAYSYDAARGSLRERQTIPTLPQHEGENLAAEIQIAPSGKHVFVSNRGPDSISVFAIESDRTLALAAVASCGGRWPRHFGVAPGGKVMLVANERSDQISVLPLTQGSTTIGATVGSAAVPRPSCVQFYSIM